MSGDFTKGTTSPASPYILAFLVGPDSLSPFHRIAERVTVARRFIDLASRFLERAMLPLMLGVGLNLGKTPVSQRLEALAVK
ncbi:MAG: hypothetical protein WB586_19425 [Chthoniobacterales bacterium]